MEKYLSIYLFVIYYLRPCQHFQSCRDGSSWVEPVETKQRTQGHPLNINEPVSFVVDQKAPIKDSDQHAHLRSLSRVFDAKDPTFLHTEN